MHVLFWIFFGPPPCWEHRHEADHDWDHTDADLDVFPG